MSLPHFVRAPLDDLVIQRKCPWGAMTPYLATNHLLIPVRIVYGSNEETTLAKGKRAERKMPQ